MKQGFCSQCFKPATYQCKPEGNTDLTVLCVACFTKVMVEKPITDIVRLETLPPDKVAAPAPIPYGPI